MQDWSRDPLVRVTGAMCLCALWRRFGLCCCGLRWHVTLRKVIGICQSSRICAL